MADLTITLLNNVLRGLRREEIASGTTTLTSEYHLTLLDWLNIAKSEVEETWDWEQLFVTATVTQAAVTDVTMSLQASAGFSDVDVNNKAVLLYEQRGNNYLLRSTKSRAPAVFDVTPGKTSYQMTETSVAHILRRRATDATLQIQDPCYFALRDRGDGYKEMLIYPQPAEVRTFQMEVVQPQDNLLSTAISEETLAVPSRPVWLRALWYANQERGDEMGREGSTLAKTQDDALANAVGRQMTAEDNTAYVE